MKDVKGREKEKINRRKSRKKQMKEKRRDEIVKNSTTKNPIIFK